MEWPMQWQGDEGAVRVAAGPVVFEGNLSLPEAACGMVLFAHGRKQSPQPAQSPCGAAAQPSKARDLAGGLVDPTTLAIQFIFDGIRESHLFR
jgi:hypothetical protein